MLILVPMLTLALTRMPVPLPIAAEWRTRGGALTAVRPAAAANRACCTASAGAAARRCETGSQTSNRACDNIGATGLDKNGQD